MLMTHLHVNALVATPGVVTLGPLLGTDWPLLVLALIHILAAVAIGGQLVAPRAGAGVASRLVAALALAPRILQDVITVCLTTNLVTP